MEGRMEGGGRGREERVKRDRKRTVEDKGGREGGRERKEGELKERKGQSHIHFPVLWLHTALGEQPTYM